jgi:AraC-like DNA-binding protein
MSIFLPAFCFPFISLSLNSLVPSSSFLPTQGASTLFYLLTFSFLEASAPAVRTLAAWCAHEAAFREWFGVYLGALERLGAQPATAQRSKDPRLERLLKALNDWPLDQPLRLVSLAQQAGLGERRARDLLRARLGFTPQVWLERRRLDHAKSALMADVLPVKQIACALGFRHAPHFTAWFKRATTLTPTAFRTAHRHTEAA